eukprot:TRINITY_DN27987_c0_g1_i1.p1 TRINITY_DN27987_c0_g1~~TRINITY_DN27987_c0_g1_i1.p1  ORF type:complete len:376 (+),score=95.64 TRINITY_DN27987_c0_g1_i1:54-1181(+)
MSVVFAEWPADHFSQRESGLPDASSSLTAVLQRALRSSEEVLVETDLRRCLQAAADYKARAEFLSELLAADIPARLLSRLEELDFEAQKDASRFFVTLLSSGAQSVEYMQQRMTLAKVLIQGCSRPEVVLHYGCMLRSLMHSPELTASLLESKAALDLMDLATDSDFDVSADAFTSLRELLLTHKKVAVAYLCSDFEAFFHTLHTKLLSSEADTGRSYMTKRQALRLLGDMLLDPAFAQVMQRYSSDAAFLRIIMNLLRDESKLIKLGTFHVFKIFVANPRKTARVQKILSRNKAGLLKLVSGDASVLVQLAQEAEEKSLDEDLTVVRSMLESLAPLEQQGAGRTASKCSDSDSSPGGASSANSPAEAGSPERTQ